MIAVLLAGCGNAGPALEELEGIQKEACACKDAMCAAKSLEKLAAWSQKHKETKGTQSQQQRAIALVKEAQTCAQRTMAGPSGEEAPAPAPAPAAPPAATPPATQTPPPTTTPPATK